LTVKNASALLEFLKQAFEAVVVDHYPDEDGNIMHACVRIGDSHVELSECNEKWPHFPCALHFYVPDVDEAHRRALAAGGKELFAPADMEYGERGSGIKDPVGNNWFLATYKGGPKANPS